MEGKRSKMDLNWVILDSAKVEQIVPGKAETMGSGQMVPSQ